MPRDVARDTLYHGIINLWVEDELTQEYLSAIWNDPKVAFFIGGGNEGVVAIVNDAEKNGFRNVFGLIDRDFRPTNRTDWHAPGKTFLRFILPVHEIENYLLDSPALAASDYNTRKQSIDQIEEHLTKAARRLTWWAACRDVVAELKRRFRDPFVPDPPRTIADETAANDHICASEWFSRLPQVFDQSTKTDIFRLLATAHAKALSHLSSGQWRVEFAGKEIYNLLSAHLAGIFSQLPLS